MNIIEIRTSIEAHYRSPACPSFLQQLKWKLHDMLWGGMSSPSNGEDICKMWVFDVVNLHPTPDAAGRVRITIDGRYETRNAIALIDHMKIEIEKHLDFSLTPCGYAAPISRTLSLKEWPFRMPEPALKVG